MSAFFEVAHHGAEHFCLLLICRMLLIKTADKAAKDGKIHGAEMQEENNKDAACAVLPLVEQKWDLFFPLASILICIVGVFHAEWQNVWEWKFTISFLDKYLMQICQHGVKCFGEYYDIIGGFGAINFNSIAVAEEMTVSVSLGLQSWLFSIGGKNAVCRF